MERENFYILLDLSVEPPESDPVKIDEAIKRKQTEWSRFRNHPTKGIQAQKYIGMVPDIRNVMMDPGLRENEARKALEIISSRKQEKFSEIDRHLEILMSKGFIKDEEIIKLARLHKVAPNEIRERIQYKEREKYAELDNQIRNRSSKGYITEAEIEALAKMHGLEPTSVRSRVTGPIKKESRYKLKNTRLLDPSIRKVIEDNLKIVGKSSLYDFLEISSEAGLAELQQKAKDKETDVLKSRKKDALATASGVLVGHCISLFKNERNRASYDATRADSHLSDLNSDIDVAGIEGVIRADNFEFLIQRAVEFGMEQGQAAKYIKKYCARKKWRIETARKKEKSAKKKIFNAATLIILSLAAAYYGHQLFTDYKNKNEAGKIIAKAESQEELEDKIAVLRDYLRTHEKHKYTARVNEKYREYKSRESGRRHDLMMETARNLIRREKLDQAMELYRENLSENPSGPFASELKKAAQELETRIEQRDYRALEDALELDVSRRIFLYSEYLKKHPSGKGRQNVAKLLADLGDAYYVSLKDELEKCASQENHEKCIRLCDGFIEAFPDDRRSAGLEKTRENHRRQLMEQMVFKELKKKALEKGDDFAAAKKIFESYLEINPDTGLKYRIENEIEELEKARLQAENEAEIRRRAAMLENAGGRFVLEKEDVVKDARSGLMWALWDSSHFREDCLDYEAAIEYTAGLKTGGFSDWRIPTPGELAGIYKTEPFFPFNETEWYWTSASYKSYVDGWIETVETITSEPATVYKSRKIDSRMCGAVRPVRP